MTTAEEAYKRYIIKSEKNGTNSNLSTNRERFVVMYNELSVRHIKWYLNNRQYDELKDIQVLLVDDKRLDPEQTHNDHVDFKLPDNYLEGSYAWARAQKGKCTNVRIELFEIRDEDRGQILTDSFFGPSFDYREFPYHLSQDRIKVYKEKDSEVKDIYLSYYRRPNQIGLLDEDNPESGFDPSKKIELPDQVLDRIISAMVGDFKLNNESPAFQADKFREKENIQ